MTGKRKENRGREGGKGEREGGGQNDDLDVESRYIFC